MYQVRIAERAEADRDVDLLQACREAAEIVHPVFVAQGWEICLDPSSQPPFGVPGVDHLTSIYRDLVEMVITRKASHVRTARLSVHGRWPERESNDDRLGDPLQLEFGLEALTAFPEVSW